MYGIYNILLHKWATLFDTGMTLGLPSLDNVVISSEDKKVLEDIHSQYLRPYNAYKIRPIY